MNNDSVYATYDEETTAYTDPDHDPEGQRQISLVSDTWYPGTCEVRYRFGSKSFEHLRSSCASEDAVVFDGTIVVSKTTNAICRRVENKNWNTCWK